jgi:hypothetical protein
MKLIGFLLLMVCSQAKADLLFSAVLKNGPNGYIASGTSSSSATKTTSSTTNNLNISDRIQNNLGARLEYLTSDSPLVFGVGIFTDTTLEASIGFRL